MDICWEDYSISFHRWTYLTKLNYDIKNYQKYSKKLGLKSPFLFFDLDLNFDDEMIIDPSSCFCSFYNSPDWINDLNITFIKKYKIQDVIIKNGKLNQNWFLYLEIRTIGFHIFKIYFLDNSSQTLWYYSILF